MARRTWIATLAIVVLLVACAELLGRGSPLRSEHAAPAPSPPAGPVVVTAGGKVFHAPSCTFIHGAPQQIDARQALRQGYAPCVRCEAALLGR